MVACLILVMAARTEAHADLEVRLARTTHAIAHSPDRPDLLLRRAELYGHSGDFSAAHADLDRAARIAPALREIDYRRAELLLDEGVAAQAVVVLDELLAADPDHVGGHIARARALRRLGRPLDAAAAYTQALDRTPSTAPDLYLERADALAAAGPSHVTAAISGLDEGLETLGPLPALTRAAVELELRANRAEAALARVEIEIMRSRQPLWWIVRKAELLDASGRGDQARTVYAEAWQHLIAQPAYRRGQPSWRELEARLQLVLSQLSKTDSE
jgi:tetratricopeptide (TPR) repeat protein